MAKLPSKLSLKPQPTLKDFQKYVAAALVERGFGKQDVRDELLMLCEEVGELAKAARKVTGVRLAIDSKQTDIAEELADVFWMTMCVANRLGIDLEQAFRAKEAKNKLREWK